jgi:leucyl aminopeptidase
MQKIVLKKIDQVVPSEHSIILVCNDSDFAQTMLSKQEIDFVKQEFEKKNYQVFINRYSYWIFVQSFDKTKTTNQIKENLRKAGSAVCQQIIRSKIKSLQIIDLCGDKTFPESVIEGVVLGNYQFLKYLKDVADKKSNLNQLNIYSPECSKAQLNSLQNLLTGVYIARDLVNEPASYLTSTVLAREFEKLGKEAGFKVEVFDRAKILSLKMGGIMAVNKGSSEPPTFSVLSWRHPNAKNAKPIILVGKGVVYDTGGYSLKPTPDSMDYMKCDMAGAAAVASVLYAAAMNNLPLNIIGLIPSTDNRVGPDAYAPGDIIKISDGTTVEVMNTDAEGRLILADALTFAKKFTPDLVVSIATLTGAAHRAIGSQGVVGMGNAPDDMVQKLLESGDETYERIAVFPFWEEYKELLKSDIADLKNIGGELAGAITAGKFLEHFTDYPYFHLDIAGMAFFKKADSYRSAGGTGISVRLLYRFLEKYIAN